VREVVAEVLGLGRGETVALDKGFIDLGMDSLTSVELRQRLQQSLGLSLPATLAFDHPSTAAVVAYLGTKLPALGGDETPVAAAPAVEEDVAFTGSEALRQLTDESLEELSEERAEELLLGELERMDL